MSTLEMLHTMPDGVILLKPAQPPGCGVLGPHPSPPAPAQSPLPKKIIRQETSSGRWLTAAASTNTQLFCCMREFSAVEAWDGTGGARLG